MKDYDITVLYHPGKLNMVMDGLSRLSMGIITNIEDGKKELVRDFHRLARLVVDLVDSNEGSVIVQNGSELSLIADVKAKKDLDLILVDLKKSVSKKTIEAFPKGEMVSFNTKWEDVIMDFIMGLPRTHHEFDSILVMMDRMTKSSHFFPINASFPAKESFQKGLRTQVKLSPTFHPQADGQAERAILTLVLRGVQEEETRRSSSFRQDFLRIKDLFRQIKLCLASEKDGNREQSSRVLGISEILRMNPPDFASSSVTEDPENFMEELQKVFEVMHIADVERVELVAYQLKGVSRV
ncbi:hypothetical protein MTR67_048046 [Solanum verrucosum]|uniref:Gag-pol polyprotein n=1 Tax=Solanum verrucosum TaxID=315347 RepID=A0AAF0ZX02_SOLVR|nr:hypothetical protein MTR67_048046 [Solanum verrucosum]